MTTATISQKSLLRITAVTAALLLVPLIAMQYTAEVNWTVSDFVVAGCLLFGAGLAYAFLTSRSGSTAYRAAAGIAVMGALLLIWINLAVGIIGDESNPYNLMYAGVLAVGLVGTLLARFRPLGMARALVAMAAAQILVSIIAATAGFPITIVTTAFFLLFWLAAARLFFISNNAR